jgi:hypothetical protein
MAKVIESQVESRTVNITNPIWRVILVGLILGIVYWVLVKLFQRYSFSVDQASNVSTIITAALGIVVLIAYRIEQPLVIAVATAACLWGLAGFTSGLAANEVLLWTLALYGIGYAMFFWVTRYNKITLVLILTLVIVLVMRLIAVM